MIEIRKLWVAFSGGEAPEGPALYAGESRERAEEVANKARDAFPARAAAEKDPESYLRLAPWPRAERWLCAVQFSGSKVVDILALIRAPTEDPAVPFAITEVDPALLPQR